MLLVMTSGKLPGDVDFLGFQMIMLNLYIYCTNQTIYVSRFRGMQLVFHFKFELTCLYIYVYYGLFQHMYWVCGLLNMLTFPGKMMKSTHSGVHMAINCGDLCSD